MCGEDLLAKPTSSYQSCIHMPFYHCMRQCNWGQNTTLHTTCQGSADGICSTINVIASMIGGVMDNQNRAYSLCNIMPLLQYHVWQLDPVPWNQHHSMQTTLTYPSTFLSYDLYFAQSTIVMFKHPQAFWPKEFSWLVVIGTIMAQLFQTHLKNNLIVV